MSILPPISLNTSTVPGRAGSFYFGQMLGDRVIEIPVFLVAESRQDLPAKIRELADWLFTDEPKPLILPHEPDKYYLAKVSEETNLEEFENTGRADNIRFVCNDPHAYSAEVQLYAFTPNDPEPLEVLNSGGAEAFPRLHFEFTGSTTEFAIFCGEDFLYFGRPAQVDTETPTTKRTKILDDDCSSVASYTSGVSVDGGVITGSLISTGTVIRAGDYGSGTGWHGPAGIRDLGQQIQDFTIQIEVGFKAGYPYQVGRLELYLLDINNNIIGKMAIKDSSGKVDSPVMEARAGNATTGKFFVNYSGPAGHWRQFNGPMRLTRIGNRWEFSASRRDQNGRLYSTYSQSFIDADNQYQQKLAKIQVHFGQSASLPVVSTVYLDHIQVWNERTLLSTEVPYIFEPGDVLDIDCATGEIIKTSDGYQETFYGQLDPASTFIRLLKGTNQISVHPNDIIVNSYVEFRERWL